jgi:hypothetical protein
MFAPGQMALCVDDTHPQNWRPHPSYITPIRGVVYTVRDVVWFYDAEVGGGGAHLLLEEIVNDPIAGRELAFRARRFRPVRDTSIDVFRKLLEPQPEDEHA